MKLKPTVLLATFVVTIGLLLGASTAQAVNVITDNGNVIRIENLPVVDENTEETTFYNVDFVYDTAINVYATGEFDFPDDETIFFALEAVTDALNANDPIPLGASSQGTDQFFIGNKVEDGVVVAVGGENIAGAWDQCETGCLASVALLAPDAPFTYADFTVAQDAPPAQATLISPSGTITENTPTYTWNAVENSTWYRLWVNDGTGNNIIDQWGTADQANCGDGTGECSVTPSTPLEDGTFYWWIQTYNEFGYGDWSAAMEFFVETSGVLPGQPTLISPSGTIAEDNPTYTWNAEENATSYRLWVQEPPTGGANVLWIDETFTADQANCGDGTGECSVTTGTVLVDGPYQWYIQTWNASGNGPWSDSLSFTVDTDTGGSGAEVILDENDNVIQILNLLVPDEVGDITIYNVDFVYNTAFDIYGSNLDFEFTEEDVFAALLAVTNALNENEPIPVGAGPEGTDQFFIGADEENDLVVAVGGEIIEGVWSQCETDCLGGVRVLAPNAVHTYADFTEVAD